MPTLISQSEVKIQWSDINSRVTRKRPRHVEQRSSGWHVMGVLKAPLVAAGELKLRDDSSLAGDEMPLCMAIGMAWEDWVVGLYPNIVWQPGEVCLDDIYGSPDGLSHDAPGDELMLEEFKATWMSLRTHEDILKCKKYMWQMAAYCHMNKAEYARLHVCWMAGEYWKPQTPAYMVYRLHFSAVETEQFWNKVVMPNRDRAPKEIYE